MSFITIPLITYILLIIVVIFIIMMCFKMISLLMQKLLLQMINRKTIYRFLLILIGLFAIIFFIWFRFLRMRVPRNLPFTLLVLVFIIFVYITVLYLYLIYRLFKPVDKKNIVINELYNMLIFPLEEFDTFIKQHSAFTSIFVKYYKKIKNIPKFYIITTILPRFILSSVLIIDVFVFFKFNYIYKILIISAIPLITRYFIYSLNKIKDNEILALSSEIDVVNVPYIAGLYEHLTNTIIEEDDDDVIPEYTRLPLDLFIRHQTNCILFNKENPEYNANHTNNAYNQYKIKYKVKELSEKHFNEMQKESISKIEKTLQLSLFVTEYQQACLLHKYIRNLRVAIYAIYFCCWSYILFFTAPKVLWITGLISLIHTLPLMEDPFSGQYLFYDLIEYVIINGDLFIIDIVPKINE